MYCQNCSCNETCLKYNPIGTDTPDIYVLGDIASVDDGDTIYSGKIGRTLFDIFDSQGLNTNNCRFNYLLRTKLFDADGKRINTIEATKQCIHYFEEDFEAHKPKVLIVVGFTVAKNLFDIKLFSEDKKGIFQYKGVPTVIVNHINYIQNHETENKDLYNELIIDICIARNIALGLTDTNAIEYVNIVKAITSKTVPCLTYKDFDDFCVEYIDNYDTVAYDIETNAAEVHSVYHEVVGFSLASSKDVGCYVVMSSLDYEMSSEDKKSVENRIRDILDTKRVIVYNCQHEIPATLNWLDIEMSNVDDVFVQVKLMTGSASDKYRGTRGLKTQASTHLKYNDWSADLDKYMEYVSNYTVNKDNIRELMSIYYDETEIDSIMSLIDENVDKFVKSVGADIISYGYVPYKLIARYGSIDASVLFELRDFYLDWMKRESETLNIDLNRGYEYWMQHHYAGYTLEKNGAYWNDDKAEEINQWCHRGLIEAQKELIRSPLSQKYLKSNFKERFYKYLMDEHISEILGDDYTPDRLYKTSINVIALTENAKKKLATMSLRPITRKSKNGEETPVKNGNVYKLQLGNVYALAQDYLRENPTLFDDWYTRTINDYINEEHTIEEYKTVLNPNATSAEFREFVSDILVTDVIRYAKFYRSIQQLTEDPSYDIDLYKDFINSEGRVDNSHKRWGFDIKTFKLNNPSYTYQDTKDSHLIKLIDKLRVDDTLSSSDKFDMFMKHVANNGVVYKTYQIKKLYSSCMNYKMETLDAVALNDIYEMYLMCHMDVEDKSTWDDKFTWLYYYKMYKKYAKTISTYINGNVGRGNAYYVDTSDFENNVYMPKRQELYEGKKENKSLLVQQNFKINMAATGRWQCLTGDTIIPLLDGRNVPIAELENYGDFYVYSYDFNSGHIVPGYCKWCRCTGTNVPIVEVTLDNGEKIRCTPDHKFMKRNGHYVKAKDLQVGQSLMPLYRRLTKDGYEEIYLVNKDVWKRTHHLCQEMIYGENWKYKKDGTRFVSHHKDFDKTNNDPRNLTRVEFNTHYKYHSKNAKWRAIWSNSINRKKHAENSRYRMIKNNSDVEYQKKCHDGMVKWLSDEKNYVRKQEIARKNILVCHKKREQNGEYIESRKKGLRLFWDEMYNSNTQRAINFREKHIKSSRNSMLKMYDAQINPNNSDYDKWQYVRDKKLIQSKELNYTRCVNLAKNLLQEHNTINCTVYEANRPKCYCKWNTLINHYGNEENLMQIIYSTERINHKVISIEYVGYADKVYDLHVENYHNFALASGIVVANCGMHNLPAGPGIKSIFTSRYKGGCIAMPDGSQMEIRILSVESGDENLIQAFKDGVDIHRFFASKIFNRPYDEVEKWQRGLAKNAVFGMIYGESEKTFADSYLHGDLSAAQKVFNDMFTGFPKIKTYIDRAHEQYEKFGKVTTLTQRYINLEDPRQDHNAILRQSQNFPIQASAEDIAGLILYKLCKWLKENNMRSKPFCFIHDSIEIDIYPPELLKIYDKINYLFNVYPMQEFNAPVECDVPFGMSMGEECVVEDMDCDEAFNEATFVLKGYLDEMDDLIENWKTVYKVVEVLDKFEDEVTEEYVPWSNVFLAKKSTLSMLTGTKRYKGARKVHLVLE